MPRYAAFLRAVNVGGRVVKMDALKKIFESMGLADVETFIASGNVVFSSKGVKGLDAKIAAGLEKALGYEVPTFVRTVGEIADLPRHGLSRNGTSPRFPTYLVGFLSKELDAAGVERLSLSRRRRPLPRPRARLLVALEAPPGPARDHGPAAREGARPADDAPEREHDPEDGGEVRPYFRPTFLRKVKSPVSCIVSRPVRSFAWTATVFIV